MQKTYPFNGWREAAGIRAMHSPYPGIETPLDLYEALQRVWCPQTCAPRLRPLWSPHNNTCGQCSVTAFLVQDLFGGEVYGMETEDGLHCYNRVGDTVFDLTCEQFGDKAAELVYDCALLQDRDSAAHFAKPEKRRRYELLKERLLQTVSERSL